MENDSHKVHVPQPANENGWNYRGKGLLQVTWKEGYTNAQNAINARYQGATNILEHPEVIDGSDEYAIIAGCADWYASELFTPADKGTTQVAVDGVTHVVNSKTDSKTKRWEFFRDITSPTFRVAECSRGKSAFEATDGIVTYHIDSGFSIEKHVPKRIKQGYEKKYKYVYHDGDGKEHEVCTLDWTEIDKMMSDGVLSAVPNGYDPTKTMQTNELGVNQHQAYYYPDGSVVAKGGAGEGGGALIRRYKKVEGKSTIVAMKDLLDYSSGNTRIRCKFQKTIRKYMEEAHFAALIGALAECGFDDIVSQGAAMIDGTCFPSVAHVNGQSIDTEYLKLESNYDHARQGAFINALYYFGLDYILCSPSMTFKHTHQKEDHKSHLHCGSEIIKFIIIKE